MADQLNLVPVVLTPDPPAPIVEYMKDRDGFLWRRFGSHRIAGVDLILYERIRPSDLSVVSSERPLPGDPASIDEWNGAMAKTLKYLRDRDAKESARRDAERFGVRTTSRGGRSRIAIRVTRTQIFTHDGARWSRRTGVGIGSDKYTALDLKPIEDATAGRELVDFVAERKVRGHEGGESQ